MSVQWQEKVGHPGHFRISLARDRSELIDPAVVTTAGDGVSGDSISADIEDPPTYPVLADGLFQRDSVVDAASEPFSMDVEIPADLTCEKCTLQVIQFMANHTPGYFYHHCADLQIVAADAVLPETIPPRVSSSLTTQESRGLTAQGDPGSSSNETGGCALPGHPNAQRSLLGGWGAFLSLGLVALMKRRRGRD